MIIKGKLIKCKREVKEFDKKRRSEEKLFITLAEADVDAVMIDKLQEVFKDSGSKFTPDWVKNFDGYVNLSTKYELPFRDVNKVEYSSIEAAIENGLKWIGAEVKVSVNLKEGALYPSSLIMLTEGEAHNAFAEFDNEDEE